MGLAGNLPHPEKAQRAAETGCLRLLLLSSGATSKGPDSSAFGTAGALPLRKISLVSLPRGDVVVRHHDFVVTELRTRAGFRDDSESTVVSRVV